MVFLSKLAQHLNTLLLVAESLEGALPSHTRDDKKKAKLNDLFILTQQDQIVVEPKTLLRRLFHPKESYDIEKNFLRINALYDQVQTSDRELKVALRELHSQGAHKAISNPVDALLMCKYRLNAILTHVAQKKDKVQDLYQFKITWNPVEKSAASAVRPSILTRQAHAKTRKVVHFTQEHKEAQVEEKSSLKQGVSSTPFKEYPWMGAKGGDLSDSKVLKRMFYEFAETITRGVEEGPSSEKASETDFDRKKRQAGEFKRAKNDVSEQFKLLPEDVQKKLVKLCSNTRFKQELSQVLTLIPEEWKEITEVLKGND